MSNATSEVEKLAHEIWLLNWPFMEWNEALKEACFWKSIKGVA